MKAIPFPQANKMLKAPPGQEADVYDLHVWGGEEEGVERCISCWEPSPEERARIAAGAPVWLWVMGHTHPPLVLDATHPFEKEEPKASPGEGPPRGDVLARFPAQRDDTHDIAEEYAIVAIDIPPGIMLWGRVENRWFANPSGREVIRQLLGRAASTTDQRPTVAESFREVLDRLTLTEEERRIVATARIAASPGDEALLAIIDRMTATRPVSPEGDEDPVP